MTLQPNPGSSKKPTSSDIAYWMGRVDGRLEEVVNVIKALSVRVDKIEERLDSLDEVDKTPLAVPQEESDKLTFQWLVEKALLPVVMLLIGGIISWILARGLP